MALPLAAIFYPLAWGSGQVAVFEVLPSPLREILWTAVGAALV